MKKLGLAAFGIGFLMILGAAGNFDVAVLEGTSAKVVPLAIVGVILMTIGVVLHQKGETK